MLPSYFRLSCVAIAAWGVAVSGAFADDAAKEKLKQAADTLTGASALQYKVVSMARGQMAAFSPVVRSEVFMLRTGEGADRTTLVRQWGRGELALGGKTEGFEFKVVSDGKTITWQDDEAKQIVEQPAGTGVKSTAVDSVALYTVPELTDPTPLKDVLAAEEATLGAPAEVGGVKCDVVTVKIASPEETTRWWIGQEDHLVRQMERLIAGGDAGDSQMYTLTEIKLNPELKPALFTLPPPEGYTKVSGQDRPKPAPAAADPKHTRAMVGQGKPLPDWELKDAYGKKLKLSDLRGNVVLMQFGGTWSRLVRESAPELDKLAQEYKDKPVKVYWLAVREKSDEEPSKFWVDGKYNYGLLLGADEAAKSYGVGAYPSWIIAGFDGEQVVKMSGFFPEKTLAQVRQEIDKYLAGKAEKPAEKGEKPVENGGGK